MKILTLKRIAENNDGTFGVLLEGDIPFAVTCERQWRNNERFISCIPEGNYICQRKQSSKFGETFEIMNVLGRGDILFHKGNVVADTQGCILIGEQFESLGGRVAILQSGKGFTEFMERLKGGDGFTLIVK